MMGGGAKDVGRWKGHAGAACARLFSKKKMNNGSLEELHLNSWCEAQ